MRCRKARRLIDVWGAGEDVGNWNARELEIHVSGCPSCGPLYGDVLPFILRDSRRVGTVQEAVSVPVTRTPAAGNPRLLILAISIGISLLVVGAAITGTVRWYRLQRGTEVLFSLNAPDAHSVTLVGDFSAWDTKGIPMRKGGNGVWTVKVFLEKGKSYRYNFLLNKERLISDPTATLRVPDGMGGESSILRVE